MILMCWAFVARPKQGSDFLGKLFWLSRMECDILNVTIVMTIVKMYFQGGIKEGQG